MRTTRSRTSGLTILELVISLALLALITTYLLETFTVNQRAYSVVEQISEVQQNLRAASDLLERDIRHTGFMVPAGGAFCAVDDFSGPDILYLTDPDAFDQEQLSGANNGADLAVSNVAAGVINNFAGVNMVIEPGPGSPLYDTDGDTVPDSDFQVDGGAIITDRNNPDRGTACGRVELVDAGTGLLRVEMESGALGAGTGTDLIAIPAIEYRVTGGVLTRNGIEMVRGVDDFQVAFQIDLNGDNRDDPGEMHGDGVGPDFVSGSVDLRRAREVRVNLVMRTRGEDKTFGEGQFQAFENRIAIAGNDGFRRRSYTASEQLRNVVMR